jgi:putative inorganic carbon (hco3(-)) transporter
MAWFLFIVLHAFLYIRPGDLFPSLEFPVYSYLIWACLAASATNILKLPETPSLGNSPITWCVLGLLAAAVLSHLSHFQLGLALAGADVEIRLVIYYFLLISVVDSLPRLESFWFWSTGFVMIVTVLALLHFHELIDIPALKAFQQNDIDPTTGEKFVTPRLLGTGIFNDPNDLSMVLVYVIVLSLYLFDARPGFLRFVWLVAACVFAYALKLTQSRGGLLNLAVCLLILSRARLGWKKTLLFSFLALPVALALFAGRMTRMDFGNSEDTSQGRLQIWAEGFILMRRAPLFGIGINQYHEQLGHVAHNSFVHTYVELGFFGGTLFMGAFFTAIWAIRRLGSPEAGLFDPGIERMRPYMLAAISSHCIGMYSLSRPYTVPTYMIMGLGTAFLHITERRCAIPAPTCSRRFIKRLVTASLIFFVLLQLFVRLMVRWN